MPPQEDSQTSTPRWGQPEPKPNDGPSMHDLVAADMMSRKAFGLNKYETLLQAFNGRDPLKDAYEEVLDLAVYLRQCLYERAKREEWLKEGRQYLDAVVTETVTQPALPFFANADTEVLRVEWDECQ